MPVGRLKVHGFGQDYKIHNILCCLCHVVAESVVPEQLYKLVHPAPPPSLRLRLRLDF